MARPEGIDVSNNNGGISWDAVIAAGVQFAVAKITESTDFRDGFFRENWLGMKRLGARGAYHFAQPDESGPEAQADYFVDAFGLLGAPLEPGDFLALDLETGTGNLLPWTVAFMKRVASRVGFMPLFYSTPSFMAEHGLLDDQMIQLDCGLWLASWRSTIPAPPAPWPFITIWQQADNGRIPGVAGNVDIDFYNGDDIAVLRKYGMPGGVIVPVPTAPSADPRDEQIASLKRDLDDARMKLGVASVDYVRGLRDLADALERLNPAA